MSFTPEARESAWSAVWREETSYQPGARTSPMTETRTPFIRPRETSERTSLMPETFPCRKVFSSSNVFPATWKEPSFGKKIFPSRSTVSRWVPSIRPHIRTTTSSPGPMTYPGTAGMFSRTTATSARGANRS